MLLASLLLLALAQSLIVMIPAWAVQHIFDGLSLSRAKSSYPMELLEGAFLAGATIAFLAEVAKRREKLGKDAPDELLTASGSGLDPHLSPDAAKYQAARIAEVRKIDVAKVISLIERLTEGPQLGFLGEARVNVLGLNQTLDELR